MTSNVWLLIFGWSGEERGAGDDFFYRCLFFILLEVSIWLNSLLSFWSFSIFEEIISNLCEAVLTGEGWNEFLLGECLDGLMCSDKLIRFNLTLSPSIFFKLGLYFRSLTFLSSAWVQDIDFGYDYLMRFLLVTGKIYSVLIDYIKSYFSTYYLYAYVWICYTILIEVDFFWRVVEFLSVSLE